MTTDRAALEKAIAEIRFWHDRNPTKKVQDEPDEIAAHRQFAMRALAGLREGDEDPWLGKNIRKIVRKSARCIVYLDDRYEAQWWWIDRVAGMEQGLSLVQANISKLEADSAFLGSDRLDLRMGPVPKSRFFRSLRGFFMVESADELTQRINERAREKLESIRALIAESMAMILNGATVRDCKDVQAIAEQQILVAKDQACRGFFFRHFAYATAVLAVAAAVVGIAHLRYASFVPDTIVDLFEAALAGAFGACISAMTRTRQLALEPESGMRGLKTEAWSRALIGAGAAILVSFAYDARLLVKGAIASADVALYLRLFLCIVAGASERILPNLVRRGEDMVDGGGARTPPRPDEKAAK